MLSMADMCASHSSLQQLTLLLCRCWYATTWGATSSQQDSIISDYTSSAYTRLSIGGSCDKVSNKYFSWGY